MRAAAASLVVATLSLVPAAASGQAAPAAASALPVLAPTPRFADPGRRAALKRVLPEIARLVESRMAEMHAPGASFGVVIDGEPVFADGRGVRKAGGAGAVNADTVFRIASMSKSFTALAILLLRDEGRLSLDDPAAKYVPALAGMPLPTRDSPPLTVRHLLTHSAGFPEDNPWGDRQLAVSNETMDAWVRAGLPFSTAPGTAFEYSNYGFALLGRIVSHVSGMPYERFITTRILQPLGMTSTVWDAQDVPAGRLAMGHRYENGAWTPEPPLGDGAFGAMGGLFTSARDLSRYVAFMLSAWPPRDDEDRGPVRRSSVREMQQGQRLSSFGADRPSPDQPLRAATRAYAYGLSVSRDCRFAHLVAHGGGLPGYGSTMTWLPEYGVGVIVLANVTYAPAGGVGRAILDRFDATGGLQPRVLPASAALVDAQARITSLVRRWDDDAAERLAADNLLLDRSLADRRVDVARLREEVGPCEPGGDVQPENWLRGTFRLRCERGWVDASFTLAPTTPPRVQYLAFTAGRPLRPAAAGLLEQLVTLINAWDDGVAARAIGAPVDRGALRRQLAALSTNYGSCRTGDVLNGNGATRFRIRLECDRGRVDLGVDTDAESARVTSLAFARPDGETCVP